LESWLNASVFIDAVVGGFLANADAAEVVMAIDVMGVVVVPHLKTGAEAGW